MQMVNKIITRAHKQSKSPAQGARSAGEACVGTSHGFPPALGRTWTRQQLMTLNKSWEQR